MQDTRNENAAVLLTIENDVSAMLVPTQARGYLVATPAQPRIVSQGLTASLKLAEVPGSLGSPPLAKRVFADA
jgi:hypothetical protein